MSSSFSLLCFALHDLFVLPALGLVLHGLADTPSSPDCLDDDGGSTLPLSLSLLLLSSLTLSLSLLHDLRVLEVQHGELLLQLAQLRLLVLVRLRQVLQLRLRTSENKNRNTQVQTFTRWKTLSTLHVN